VQTWRRLQQLGALPVKQTVYVLPDTPAAREDFEWLKAEIAGAGGDASVFVADTVDQWSDDALVEEFTRTRRDAYATLAREMENVLRKLKAAKNGREGRSSVTRRMVSGFRQRVDAITQIDFFGAPGRDRVTALLNQFETLMSPRTAPPGSSLPRKDVREYVGRLWVTRPRPGVDRMASAWLIKRCIDPRARFGFAESPERVPRGALPFDMFGVEFSHHGDLCTFEALCAMFAINDPLVGRLATIVHDLDLKDDRFGAPEAATVGAVIDGLQLSIGDDQALLAEGVTLFESLYQSFAQSTSRRRPVPSKRRGSRRVS
jgi:hypothetical protein